MSSYPSNAQTKAQVDASIERVNANAGSDWSISALAAVEAYALNTRGMFLTEDVRAYYKDTLDLPHDGRAWGQVMRQAVRNGSIVHCGFAPAKTSNGSAKVMWRRAD